MRDPAKNAGIAASKKTTVARKLPAALVEKDFSKCFDSRFALSSHLRNHGTSVRGASTLGTLRSLVFDDTYDGVLTAERALMLDGLGGGHKALFGALILSCFTRNEVHLLKVLTNAPSKKDRVVRAIAVGRLLLELDTAFCITATSTNSDFWGTVTQLRTDKPGHVVIFIMHAFVHADPTDFYARAQRAFQLTFLGETRRTLEQRKEDLMVLDTDEAWQRTRKILLAVIFPCLLKFVEQDQMSADLRTYYAAATKALEINDVRKSYSDISHYFGNDESGLFRMVMMNIGLTETTEF